MTATGSARRALALRAANRDVVFFPKVETPEGIEDIEAIAALDGVDGIWIGHFDLSVAMGIPAKFDHPRFQAAMQRAAIACKRHGKSLGRIYDDTETGVALHAAGFDFLCCSGDSWLLQRGLSEGISALRKAAAAHVQAPPERANLSEARGAAAPKILLGARGSVPRRTRETINGN